MLGRIEDAEKPSAQAAWHIHIFMLAGFIRASTGEEKQENVAVLAAIGAGEDGHREILGAAEGMSEAQGELGRVPSQLEGDGGFGESGWR